MPGFRRPRAGRRPVVGLALRLTRWAEFGAVAVGLLEVVADDLLELAQAVAGGQLEPGCVLLVQCVRPSFGIAS